MYTTLAFLALLGAPYIYDISSLRVNNCKSTFHILKRGKKWETKIHVLDKEFNIYISFFFSHASEYFISNFSKSCTPEIYFILLIGLMAKLSPLITKLGCGHFASLRTRHGQHSSNIQCLFIVGGQAVFSHKFICSFTRGPGIGSRNWLLQQCWDL